jgi:hypothetical protein
MRSTAYKKQGTPDLWSLIQQKSYTFYTRSTTYKEQGAPDRRSLIQQKKRAYFYTCSTAYESKGLPIDGPHIFYYFQHAFRRVQKAWGSIGMCSKFVILLIKFQKKFTDQRESSSLCIIQTISHQIPIGGSIYFLYTVVINIQEVRGIYLYLSCIKFIQHAKEKDYKALGLSLSSDSARLVKSYEDTKS